MPGRSLPEKRYPSKDDGRRSLLDIAALICAARASLACRCRPLCASQLALKQSDEQKALPAAAPIPSSLHVGQRNVAGFPHAAAEQVADDVWLLLIVYNSATRGRVKLSNITSTVTSTSTSVLICTLLKIVMASAVHAMVQGEAAMVEMNRTVEVPAVEVPEKAAHHANRLLQEQKLRRTLAVGPRA